MAKKLRIGILGGAFDPVHNGHISIARFVLDVLRPDLLLMMPSGVPPYKTCAAGPEDRWRMLVAACSCDKRLIPTRIELDRDGNVYTADTLASLGIQYPGAAFYYVIGSDTLLTLRHWHRIDDVLRMCTFLVCQRPGTDNASFIAEKKRLSASGGRFVVLSANTPCVSSTEIRASLAAGILPDSLDISVGEYCSCLGLYGLPSLMKGIDKWIDRLFAALKPHRFAHSLSVARTARLLADRYDAGSLQAEQAGLLHDCAKCLPLKEMRQIAEKNSLTADPHVLSSGALLHSLVGAQVAKDLYGMTDPAVLEAIACHNTGRPHMSRLAMCVCLADFIEPLRDSFPLLEQVRDLSFTSLEQALLLSLEVTADYVRSSGKYLHPQTLDTIRWLKSLSPDAYRI